jgi:nickel/cobalt exporter
MNRYTAVAAAVAATVLLWPAAPAQAHPLGRFSVNQYAGLTLRPDRIDVTVVVDVAELPTLQDRARADTDGDGTLSATERDGYATAECGRFADGFAVTAGGQRLVWTVSAPVYELVPGTGGLDTSRLACTLGAAAGLGGETEVLVDNGYRADRVGWREITAAGDGVVLSSSTVPVDSVSERLRAYPPDLLTSALDVRTATVRVGGDAAPMAAGAPGGGAGLPGAPGFLAAAQDRVEGALGGRLTPVVVGLAFLLAVLLGAGHAVLPGHGKTVMAAYFAGRRGRIRDALAVGGTVTLAHTGAVLLVGLLLSTSTALAGERVLAALGVASGLLVVLVGLSMLLTARRTGTLESHTHAPSDYDDHHHYDGHHHDVSASDGGHSHHHHEHHHHGHSHGRGERLRKRLGLAGIGLAGGLVPSPSALVVLLGAIGLGRAGLGVALVIAYGLGMAATLTTVGLLLVVAQNRLSHLITAGGWFGRLTGRLSRLTGRIAAGAPTATAALVVIVGLGIGLRAVA